MPTAQKNYWKNRLRLRQNQSLLHPLVIVYYLTTNCNLNCTYCEDFGARFNRPGNAAEWEQITHTLQVARTGVDSLLITGGEPLLQTEVYPLDSTRGGGVKLCGPTSNR